MEFNKRKIKMLTRIILGERNIYSSNPDVCNATQSNFKTKYKFYNLISILQNTPSY